VILSRGTKTKDKASSEIDSVKDELSELWDLEREYIASRLRTSEDGVIL